MLRLERKPFHKDVTLVWNREIGEKKKSFFWSAMAYAFFVHAIGISLVTIRLLQPTHSMENIPPISAAAYTEEKEGGIAIADEGEGERQQRHWGIPIPTPHPLLPLPRPPHRYYQRTPTLPADNSEKLFAMLESYSWPIEEDIPISSDKALKVRVSGELSQLSLQSKPWKKKIFPIREPQRLRFHILVEGKTGKIIWYEALELSKDQSLNQEIEGLLRQTTFSLLNDSSFVEGEIEWQLVSVK